MNEHVNEQRLARCSDAAAWLGSLSRDGRPIKISSLGPDGTSAHAALIDLQRQAVGIPGGLTVSLHESFDDVLRAVDCGESDYAFIPSAYAGASAFHWGELELSYLFTHRTPEYGLAIRSTGILPTTGILTIASMNEVTALIPTLLPADLRRLAVQIVQSPSTSAAASMAREGKVDLAVCNDRGRASHELEWLAKRDGALIVWMFFARLSVTS